MKAEGEDAIEQGQGEGVQQVVPRPLAPETAPLPMLVGEIKVQVPTGHHLTMPGRTTEPSGMSRESSLPLIQQQEGKR